MKVLETIGRINTMIETMKPEVAARTKKVDALVETYRYSRRHASLLLVLAGGDTEKVASAMKGITKTDDNDNFSAVAGVLVSREAVELFREYKKRPPKEKATAGLDLNGIEFFRHAAKHTDETFDKERARKWGITRSQWVREAHYTAHKYGASINQEGVLPRSNESKERYCVRIKHEIMQQAGPIDIHWVEENPESAAEYNKQDAKEAPGSGPFPMSDNFKRIANESDDEFSRRLANAQLEHYVADQSARRQTKAIHHPVTGKIQRG